jgi:hypothetical protein
MRQIFLFFIGIILFNVSYGQCDTIANVCVKHIGNEYISDGQLYRALLYDDQIAEFNTTFYGGSTYRLAACSGFEDGNLIYSVFDEKRNLLFTNSDFDNAPYWDFKVNATMQVIIEARLDLNKLNSGCAVMLIGFEQ